MEEVQMWEPILADPLPGRQVEIEIYSTHVDYDAMDFQALLQGPQDEHDLDRLLDGALNPTYIKEANLTHEEVPLEKEEAPASPDLSGGEEKERREGGGARYPPPCYRRSRRLAPIATPPEEGGSNLLDYVPKCGWRHGSRVRSTRKRGTWSLNMEPCSHDLHSACKGQQCRRRRNNDHWTSEEVKELVDAVSIYGVGHWTELKNERFPTSVRTAVHLKDKWRNLLKAYTAGPTSKKKGNSKRRISPPIDRDCVKKIQRLAADYPRK